MKEAATKVHHADPDIILEAAIFEAIYEKVDRIPIPDWVYSEFQLPIRKRNFRYAAMLYEDNKFRDHWTKGASIPDMSKLETRMYFYYRGRRYIDSGCEAIHFGQVELMDQNDLEHRYWWDLMTRLRRYAAQNARRGIVLCSAHTHGIVINGYLLFDYHAYPLIAREVQSKPMQAELAADYYSAIYGKSKGGRTPSGWSCTSLPYLGEIDSGGSNGNPGKPSSFPWLWGYDGIGWYSHLNKEDRDAWLHYAWNWLRARNEDAWLQMPTRRNLAVPVEDKDMYQANTRWQNCPIGMDQEETIRSIWDSEERNRKQEK